MFLAWLPLAYLVIGAFALAIAKYAEAGLPLYLQLGVILLHTAAFALACFGAGYFVGRFGGKATSREAGVGAVLAALFAWGLAISAGARGGMLAWILVLAVMVGLALVTARRGAVRGRAARRLEDFAG